jgi:uncharacterized protein YndB with AHSA1/START domain
VIRASAATIYQAFASPAAMEAWLPPQGMRGKMLSFAFCEGGAYRMRLTYNEPQTAGGKTSADTDVAEVKFAKLVENQRLEQTVKFESDDPSYHGVMRITWILEPKQGGTLVTVRCEDVPFGIGAKEHEEALASTLVNLATFAEATGE